MTDSVVADLNGPVEPVIRRYAVQLTFRAEDPILTDRPVLERRLTDELIEHMRRDGVEIHPDTRLPGFSLHRNVDGLGPALVAARIECGVAQLPPLRWARD